MKPSFLLGGIGVAVTVLLGYNMVYKPQEHQLNVIRAQVLEERVRQETAAGVAASLNQLEQYRTRLPSEPDPSWLVGEVVALAEASGVQLTTINQETPQQFESFTRLSVRLQLTASYHQVGAFLDHIERSNRFIRVERVDIGRNQDSNAQSAAVEMVVSTLYVPPGLSAVGGGALR